MAQKKLKVGDPVLWYGLLLTVVSIEKRDDVELAHVASPEGQSVKDRIMPEIRELRATQVGTSNNDALSGDAHKVLDDRIRELAAELKKHIVQAKLRVELLSWWPEREVWVSDGRILTDGQIDKFKRITGKAPVPSAQREALTLLEGGN